LQVGIGAAGFGLLLAASFVLKVAAE